MSPCNHLVNSMKHSAWMTFWALVVLSVISVRGQDVVINEIMYHPSSEDSREEYVELLNRAATNVNLSSWTFSGGIDFVFPTNAVIGTGQYLVVVAHAPSFAAKYPSVTNFVGSWRTFSV